MKAILLGATFLIVSVRNKMFDKILRTSCTSSNQRMETAKSCQKICTATETLLSTKWDNSNRLEKYQKMLKMKELDLIVIVVDMRYCEVT